MSASRARLYHRLQIAAHRLRRRADGALLEAAGVTTAQAAVLSLVADRGSCSQREIAQALGQQESAMTAMVRRLIEAGLIVRIRDERDGRAWRLSLTPEGRTALEAARGPFAEIDRALEEALGPDDLPRVAEALKRLSERI
ncbi:MAG TPA: MarR family transcriptional regulator [Myxococcota bacterium]|nr:MarR family transcriptional regulator [Myxococcota bacterium]